MNTQQTMITTIPYQQKNAGAQEAIKLFALYLQGITVVQITNQPALTSSPAAPGRIPTQLGTAEANGSGITAERQEATRNLEKQRTATRPVERRGVIQ